MLCQDHILTASKKHQRLWERIKSTECDNLSDTNSITLLTGLGTDLGPVFDTIDDVLPDHSKIFHQSGFVAHVVFESSNNRIIRVIHSPESSALVRHMGLLG